MSKKTYPPFRQSGRLKGEPRRELLDYVYPGPPERDRFILSGVHRFDLAHTVMLREQGVLTAEEAGKILRAFREMEDEGVEKVRTKIRGGIHSGESYLTQKVGRETAGKVPTGRSTGDLNSVSRRLVIRDALLEVMEGSLGLREVLLQRAGEHVETIMPGYSHGKRAKPTTFAHYCLFWVHPLERDFERLRGAFDRANLSTAEISTAYSSRYGLSRERVSELLGFSAVLRHSGDASWNYDFWLEAFAALAILWTTLSRLAESLNLLSGDEFGLVDLEDGFCWTSSVMPHKKNPYSLQYLKGVGAVAVGQMLSAFTVEKANPWGVIIDRNMVAQGGGDLFRETVWGLTLTREMFRTLQVNREAMKERVGEYWDDTSDLALAISQEKGIPMRRAHHIVGRLVRYGKDAGKGPRDITPEMLDQAAREEVGYGLGLGMEFIRRAIDPMESIRGRTVPGGEAPKEIRGQLRSHERKLKTDRKELNQIRGRIEEAGNKLRKAIEKIVGRKALNAVRRES